MRLIEGIQILQGAPARIPDSCRNELPEFCKEMGYTRGAEIGVYKGAYTELFCKVGLQMFAVDPWQVYDGNGSSFQRVGRMEFLYGHACRTLAPYSNCSIIRKSSTEALEDFEDNSLDFVYIDGDHSFKYIAADIHDWTHKVRKGGLVSGHDYIDSRTDSIIIHVRPVVDAYTEALGIKNWYVFGGSETPLSGRYDDRYLSWAFLKT